MTCPRCGRTGIQTWHGLRKHLSGGKASGGHALPLEEAHALAQQVASGQEAAPAAAAVPRWDEVRDLLLSSQDVGADVYLRLVLTQLVRDKALPKYQFERRIDALLTPFLPAVVERALGLRAELVVPEFPLKKPGSNQSTNADHLLLLHGPDDRPVAWLLLELKTDLGSYDLLQAETYARAARDGWPRLRADLDAIRAASTAKDAYGELLRRVDGATPDPPSEVRVLYLTPGSVPPRGFASVHFADLLQADLGPHRAVWELLRTVVLPTLV